MFLNVNFTLYILMLSFVISITGFHHKLDSIISISFKNYTNDIVETAEDWLEPFGKVSVLEISEFSDYLILGAKNKLINLRVKDSRIVTGTTELTSAIKNCTVKSCINYAIMLIPIFSYEGFNKLLCGSYNGFFQCIKTFQNLQNGTIEYFSDKPEFLAPKGLNNRRNSVFHLTTNKENNENLLYMASSWTENGQYLSAYTSRNNYQPTSLFKKIGATKDFVRFLEFSDKLFLFQNEKSFEIDEGERDRDILTSTSLVTQFCKNDENILRDRSPAFFTDLTAKIYCFNDAFKTNSANFKIFKFDSLEHVSDLVKIKTMHSVKNLFYGVFNTPKNQITGTAICIFDVNDFATVFHNDNFKQSSYDPTIHNQAEFAPQTCPNLTLYDQYKYARLTSKLGYMSKAMLPVQQRKASFMSTDEFRLSTLTVLDDHSLIFPSIKNFARYDFFNVILAGTDNGKLMRMVHFFNRDFFHNQRVEEENFLVIEDIQLFTNRSVKEIRIMKNRNKSYVKIVAIADDQVKIVTSDFCEFHGSCEECQKANQLRHHFLDEECVWLEKCVSRPKMENIGQVRCQNSTEPSYHLAKIQNVTFFEYGTINTTKTSTEIMLKNINQTNNIPLKVMTIIISVLMVLSTFILVFIVFRKFKISSIKKVLNYKKKNASKVKIDIKTKQTDNFENIYSMANTNNRVQNLYQKTTSIPNFKTNTKKQNFGTDNHNELNIFQLDQLPSDLMIDFCSISIPNSLSNYQQVNNSKETVIYADRPSFMIETENQENYFENNLIGNKFIF